MTYRVKEQRLGNVPTRYSDGRNRPDTETRETFLIVSSNEEVVATANRIEDAEFIAGIFNSKPTWLPQ